MSKYIEDVDLLRSVFYHGMRLQWCCRCKYWDPIEAPELREDREIVYYGLCRRNPPSIAREDHQGWPRSKFDDWCGEYALDKTPAMARYIEELAHAQPTDEQP